MRPLSNLVLLVCLAAVTLLVIVLGIGPQHAANLSPAVPPRNEPAKPVKAEVTNATPPPAEKGTEEGPPHLDVRDVEQVRRLFRCMDGDRRMLMLSQQMLDAGEKVFPAYEAILLDPAATSQEVFGVFCVLQHVNGDRRRFHKHTVSRLTDANERLRWNAVHLLREIGSAEDGPALVTLLSDEDVPVVFAAAEALAAIGSTRELDAMDTWLHGPSRLNDDDLRQHVKKCRDALKERLDKAAKKAM